MVTFYLPDDLASLRLRRKTPAASQPESAPSAATEASEPAPAHETAPVEESTAEAAESVQAGLNAVP